jgi:hypothetical protein
MSHMRPFAARGVRATLAALALTLVVSVLVFAPAASASHLNQTGNPCLGHSEGEGIQLPPGSGNWYQCVQQNGPGNLKAEPRPGWPEVPVALLWPLSALLAFGVYVAVQRRRRPELLRPV